MPTLVPCEYSSGTFDAPASTGLSDMKQIRFTPPALPNNQVANICITPVTTLSRGA
jgi:hypothetical protein